MKYVAIVELEYQTDGDPLQELRRLLGVVWDEIDHYHIIKQPRPLPVSDEDLLDLLGAS